MSSHFLITLVLFIIGIILFVAVARAFPHNEKLEQKQQWKISILFAVCSFILWPLIIIAIRLFEIGFGNSNSPLLSFTDIVVSLFWAILSGSCIGIYFAIIIFALVYWKFRSAPWPLFNLQAGASVFDSLVNRLFIIAGWFRRAG